MPSFLARRSMTFLTFRAHVDWEMGGLLERSIDEETSRRVMLGLNHEQQHQELALTDIKHAFFSNPLRPSYGEAALDSMSSETISTLQWHSAQGGLIEIGHPVNAEDPMGFCFDNETPVIRLTWSRSKSQTAKLHAASTWSSCRIIDLKILTKSDDKQDGLAADVAILDSSESTPSDLAADKRLRYLIAPLHGTLHFVDTRNPETKDIADEKAAVLTLLPESSSDNLARRHRRPGDQCLNRNTCQQLQLPRATQQ